MNGPIRMSNLCFSYLAVLALILITNDDVEAFYLPGVNPQSFADGDP
jgi:hypothetical protein